MTRLLAFLFGTPCALGCGQRLYPRQVAIHYYIEHAGDIDG